MTNRAAVLTKPGEIVIEERPVPQPGPREVRAPLVLGHECAGRVAAVGDRVTGHAVGARVALEPGVPCGRCRECRAGRYNLCPDVEFFATPPVHGAFARYVTIHEDFAFALPESV